MKFVDRKEDISRIERVISYSESTLTIIYGRRRIGKSRLIKEVVGTKGVYFMADQSESIRQRELFASVISQKIPGFDAVIYPDWNTLFESLNHRIEDQMVICIDEFPYLVKSSPELPSVLQRIMDNKHTLNYHLILCGSAQQLMYGLVMNATDPLYGRADEILKIQPIPLKYMQEVLQCSAVETINEYSIWGGIPRYWELRLREKDLWHALERNVLSSQGILYEEPIRLFLDEMRDTVHSFTILSLIASGSHRLTEIAARMEKPATHLSAPLAKLVMLGYIERELPFGESIKNNKKSLYKIADPFINFYFSFVVPYRSFIEIEQTEIVINLVKKQLPVFISHFWERLCRKSIPHLEFNATKFKPAFRWWKTSKKNAETEIDIVAESLDGKSILLGECKWSDKKVNYVELKNKLIAQGNILPFCQGKTIVPVLFLKEKVSSTDVTILDPQDILNCMD